MVRASFFPAEKKPVLNGDYDAWEEFYLKLEDECQDRFHSWLVRKGLSQYAQSFGFYAGFYLNFIYRYGHSDTTLLDRITYIDIEEFFLDHVLRKLMLEPNEYPDLPPAIKLLYQFLSEKGYMDDPSAIVNLLEEVEHEFIEILQQRYR